jgi:hypothetical protein
MSSRSKEKEAAGFLWTGYIAASSPKRADQNNYVFASHISLPAISSVNYYYPENIHKLISLLYKNAMQHKKIYFI